MQRWIVSPLSDLDIQGIVLICAYLCVVRRVSHDVLGSQRVQGDIPLQHESWRG
jgi:hypothetical protein